MSRRNKYEIQAHEYSAVVAMVTEVERIIFHDSCNPIITHEVFVFAFLTTGR